MPALHHAAFRQKTDLVDLLLLLGADVHATYQVGYIHLNVGVSAITMSAGQALSVTSFICFITLHC